jgi:hypothetical protein
MTSHLLFWFLLAWAVAVVVALAELALDVLAADARGAKLPARSLRSAVRTCVRCGVAFSMPVVVFPIFGTIENWDISFKLFSYDLTAYSGPVERVVLVAGFGICFVMVIGHVDRLLDKLLPIGPADRAPTAENSNDRGAANGK